MHRISGDGEGEGPDVIRVLHTSAEKWGYPASFLSDNGLIFTAQKRYGLAGAFEQELFALASKPSTRGPTTRRPAGRSNASTRP